MLKSFISEQLLCSSVETILCFQSLFVCTGITTATAPSTVTSGFGCSCDHNIGRLISDVGPTHSVPAAWLTFTILICMTLFYELYIAELSCLDTRRKFADNGSIYCLVSD